MRERFRFLLPEYLLTWQVFTASFLWAALIHFLDFSIPMQGTLLPRLVILLFVQLVMYAVLWLVARLLLPWIPATAVPTTLMIAIVVATAVRGVVFAWLLLAIGVQTNVPLLARATASALTLTLALVLATIAFGEVSDHYRQKSLLLAQEDHLRHLQQQAAAELASADESVVESVQSGLIESVRPIGQGDAHVALGVLREAIDDVVRPLSHYLDSQVPRWQPNVVPQADLAIDWRRIARDAADPREIRPMPIFGVLAIVALPLMVVRYGPAITIGLLTTTVIVGILALCALRRLGTRLARRRPGMQWLIFVLCLLVGGQLAGFTTYEWTRNTPTPFNYLFMVAPLTLVLGFLGALAATARRSATDIVEAIDQTNGELRWAAVRSQEVQRQRKRALVHLLHGHVQATMGAGFLRIQHALDDPARLKSVIASVHADVEEAIGRLSGHSEQPEDLEVVLRRIRVTWQGVADITHRLESKAAEAISRDSVCQTSLNDLATELCFNSVKHGNAMSIHVEVTLVDERTVALTVRDNGESLAQGSSTGLGTGLLESAAIEWNRTRVDGWTVTTAQLPLLDDRVRASDQQLSIAARR